ncbi:MAG: O-methyltransferase [Flavobacteriales bacterium]|nr:MAG: O-methyltransferase [Flavobacteriales bacterium]
MQFIDPALEAYCEAHSGEEPAHLKALREETHASIYMPQMCSGHLQGRFLSMLSHLVRPKVIVEIGTYTGYSALCLAEGLAPGGMLHTIDIDPHLPPLVARHIKAAGFEDRITTHQQPAMEVIPTLPTPFDLVFIDADKPAYPAYFEAVVDRMRPGGLIMADNVLWSGKVLKAAEEQDHQTAALVRYAELVTNDPRVEKVMVPLRDGLLLARRL